MELHHLVGGEAGALGDVGEVGGVRARVARRQHPGVADAGLGFGGGDVGRERALHLVAGDAQRFVVHRQRAERRHRLGDAGQRASYNFV